MAAGKWVGDFAKRCSAMKCQPDENPPLRLILCADKNEEQIALLKLTHGSIRVANDLTELLPRALLQRKLLESVEHAKARAFALKQADLPDSDE